MAQTTSIDGPNVMPASGRAPDSLIILVHGYGANGQDLIGLAPQFQNDLPDTAFFAPNAPEVCPLAPGGYQWFAIEQRNEAERDEGVYRAAPHLDSFIDAKLEEFGLGEDRLVLLGFSQGTMMSLHVALRRDKPVAGILGYSGCLAAPHHLIEEMKVRPPVMLVHGTHDNVLPFPLMFQAVGGLEVANVPVAHHLSQGVAHGIAPDGIEKGREFLKRVLR